MRYPLFEFLALTVGSVSIVVAVVATLWAGSMVEEVIAQGLLLVVLVGTVHRGRRGGLVTAIFATLTYICMRVPMVMREGLSPDVVGLVLMRTLTYGAMGIGGGALVGRIHYFLARLESGTNIDVETQLFNQRFITRTLRTMVSQHEEAHRTFSVAILSLAGVATADPRPGKRSSLRAVATYVRDQVRLIDDVARLDDGRIVLVFPLTTKPGARLAAERIRRGVGRLLGVKNESMRLDVFNAEEDLHAIRDLCGTPASADENPESSKACA